MATRRNLGFEFPEGETIIKNGFVSHTKTARFDAVPVIRDCDSRAFALAGRECQICISSRCSWHLRTLFSTTDQLITDSTLPVGDELVLKTTVKDSFQSPALSG